MQWKEHTTIANNCLLQLAFLAWNLDFFMLYSNSVFSPFHIHYQFLWTQKCQEVNNYTVRNRP